MTERINILNAVIVALGLPLFLIAWILPFSFFVDVQEVTYSDMCVGETTQLVTSLREVKWIDGYKGTSISELFKYNGIIKEELIIKREATFAYQVSSEPVVYRIEWDRPITVAGEYGASDTVTISPLIFKKTEHFSEEDQRFSVVECN